MSTPRLYFASHVLRDGRVWVLGGEYSGGHNNWTNTGEIYDPVSNTWTAIAPYPNQAGCPRIDGNGASPAGCFGDDPSMLLNGDRILAGNLLNNTTRIYDIASDTWSAPISKVQADSSDEETWVKLSSGQVLTYDLFKSIATGGAYAEKFDPVTNTWLDISPSASTALGTIPQLSSRALGYEMGPTFRLQDGRIFQIGATQNTAFYDLVSNTWSAGPVNTGWGAYDAPGAILPNGHVIFAASPTSKLFSTPAVLFDFNPATNTIAPVTGLPAALQTQLNRVTSYELRMLMLPTGQLLLANDQVSQLWVYTPDGPINPAMRPVINQIINNGGGSFTLAGKQLNGQSAGSGYGDDAESDENYPIIRLTNTSTGVVYYTKSTHWSRTDVGPGPETVDFKTPAGMPSGRYSIVAVGAGIPSFAVFTAIP
nr:kelch repeat-containing protein [Roseateles koreensis]